MCKQGNSHDHIYLDQRARLFYSQMLAKGLFNKKSLSVSTWHMGWHHTWEKERCKSVFSHKLQSWKCFHIRCFLFLICCFLMGSDTWKFSPVNFSLLLQQGCSLENFACKVASSKQWKHLLLPTWYHPSPLFSVRFGKRFVLPQNLASSNNIWILPAVYTLLVQEWLEILEICIPFGFCKTQPVIGILESWS